MKNIMILCLNFPLRVTVINSHNIWVLLHIKTQSTNTYPAILGLAYHIVYIMNNFQCNCVLIDNHKQHLNI
jgi:hypothetical protein